MEAEYGHVLRNRSTPLSENTEKNEIAATSCRELAGDKGKEE